jgi:hypothetical protein
MSVEEMLEAIKKQLLDHESRISNLEAQPKIDKDIGRKKLSIKEFILSKKPKGDIQKTLVIGFYLEKYEGLDCFNREDLENAFRSAMETVPTNVGVDANENIKKGYFAEAREKKDKLKAWYLTNSGEECVEMGLSGKE